MNWYTFVPALLNMSLTATVVILAVLLARLFLKKAPKIFSYVLWYVVLFRLLCPVAVNSPLSLLGVLNAPASESGGAASSMEYIPYDIVHNEPLEVHTPIPGINDASGGQLPRGEEQLAADPLEFPSITCACIWGIGFLTMAVYSVVSYVKVRRKLRVVVPLRDNIFLADDIASPFVIGFFRPRIYLPWGLDDREQAYIILHERHHIRRLDHIAKALAFLALSIHWFNPLVWLTFVLFGKDMEMSCDEAVIRKLGKDIRAEYSASLLTLATGRRMFAGTPLAFGEGDIRGRIRNLANWKKPRFWAVLAAVAVCAGLAVCLLTNPTDDKEPVENGDGASLELEASENEGLGESEPTGGADQGEELEPTGGADRGEEPIADTALYENSAVVIDYSDLDRDGVAESVVIRTVIPDQLYELSVEKEDGTQIWTEEAGLPHMGWNTILGYTEGTESYLVRYHPTISQGMGSYTCTVFSLEGGRETVKEEWSVDFELPVDGELERTPEMIQFSQEVGLVLRNSTVFLSTEQGILVVAEGGTTLPQLYPVRFDPEEILAAIDGTLGMQELSSAAAQRPDEALEMLFASGAGAWGTTLTLQPDGTFTGEYADANMGSATEEYPNGELSICRFSGRFGEMTQISDYAFSMELEELTLEDPVGEEWISDGTLYIASEPYGMAEGGEFILYAPGTLGDALPDAFRTWWPDAWLWRRGEVNELSGWGLLNVNTGQGFFSHETWGV